MLALLNYERFKIWRGERGGGSPPPKSRKIPIVWYLILYRSRLNEKHSHLSNLLTTLSKWRHSEVIGWKVTYIPLSFVYYSTYFQPVYGNRCIRGLLVSVKNISKLNPLGGGVGWGIPPKVGKHVSPPLSMWRLKIQIAEKSFFKLF